MCIIKWDEVELTDEPQSHALFGNLVAVEDDANAVGSMTDVRAPGDGLMPSCIGCYELA